MLELCLVLASFITIPVLRKFKISLGVSLIATAVVMAVINRLSLGEIINTFTGVFTNATSLNTVLVVAMVSVIGTMMKEYGILEKVVDALSSLIKDKRILLMIIPAFIGTLTIPGGAILSAPFALSLGEQVGLSNPRRSVVNLIFRHVGAFILPYSTTLLLAHSFVPQFSLGHLIAVNIFFIVPMLVTGYFLYIRNIPPVKAAEENGKSVSQNFKDIFIYASPIYVCIIIHIITKLPLYICILASVLILYFLGPKKDFVKTFVSSIGYKSVISVVGVYMIGSIVGNLDGLIQVFQQMFNSGTLIVPAVISASVIFGLITGFQMVPVSIVLPMLLKIDMTSGQLLAYIYLVYGGSFLGYYFSPLHMCQIFTCEFMDVKTQELWKEYIPYISVVVAYLIISFFAMSKILPLIFG